MSHVGVDLFFVNGENWLVMVDQFSGFPFVKKLACTDTETVNTALKTWFCEWGFPRVIKSDGGPQFRPKFDEFCRSFHILQELSSPY